MFGELMDIIQCRFSKKPINTGRMCGNCKDEITSLIEKVLQ